MEAVRKEGWTQEGEGLWRTEAEHMRVGMSSILGLGREGTSSGGAFLGGSSGGGSVCQHRGPAGQLGSAGRFKQSKEAVRRIWEHLLLQLGNAQRALGFHPAQAGSGEEGAKWGQVQRDLSGNSGAFEELEAQADLRAFPFPFPQSLQVPSGCSCSLAACCRYAAECAFGPGMLQQACWVVVDPECHHGSEDASSRGRFHSCESRAGPVGLAKRVRSKGIWAELGGCSAGRLGGTVTHIL